VPNQVKSWSYSALAQYEMCPAQYKYARIDKLPQPPVAAFERGNRIHKEAEDYLTGKLFEVPTSCQNFASQFEQLAQMSPLVEHEVCFDRKWRPSGWRDWNKTWFRSKVDAAVIYPDNTATIVDHKTGKKYATNEDQIELFSLTFMIRYPELKEVEARLWYLDVPGKDGEIVREFDASQKEALREKWERKVQPLFNDTLFAPKPNDKCKWCPFGVSKGGPCRHG